MQHIFSRFKTSLLFIFFGIIAFLFLPFTQDMFLTTKWYLAAFVTLSLILSSIVELLLTRKIVWIRKTADTAVLLFALTSIISGVLMSPNKVQALLNPHFGVLTILFAAIVYFYVSRSKLHEQVGIVFLGTVSLLFSLLTLFFLIQPIEKLKLPSLYSWLTVRNFSTAGTLIDAGIILGFIAAISLGYIVSHKQKRPVLVLSVVSFVLAMGNLLGIAFMAFKNPSLFTLTPFYLTWTAAVEILKQPLTLFFGVGLDNFASMFTQVKDIAYSQSTNWQIASFNYGRSTLLHIVTESGLLGGIAYCLVFVVALRAAFSPKGTTAEKMVGIYVALVSLLFPPNFLFFIFFFAWVGFMEAKNTGDHSTINLSHNIPFVAALVLAGFGLVAVAVYGMGRSYMAEVRFKKALGSNNLKEVYDEMRTAVILNPYIERFRSNFAQIHLLIANNVASKAQKKEGDTQTQQVQLSEEDRKTITQAIQSGIEEAKAVVALNNQKANNWELLGLFYRNIIAVAQGADAWTVSAYQRAITLDPRNPMYQLDLGGVLYGLKDYEGAQRLFEQAVILRPTWSNAQYNFAWAAFQRQDYQRAVAAMQSTASLLDPKKDEADYKKVMKELEEFKQKLPQQTQQSQDPEAQGEQQQNRLTIPTPPQEGLEPKITLPKTASPEAK